MQVSDQHATGRRSINICRTNSVSSESSAPSAAGAGPCSLNASMVWAEQRLGLDSRGSLDICLRAFGAQALPSFRLAPRPCFSHSPQTVGRYCLPVPSSCGRTSLQSFVLFLLFPSRCLVPSCPGVPWACRMLPGSWWLVLPVTRAPERSPAGASPDLYPEDRTPTRSSPHWGQDGCGPPWPSRHPLSLQNAHHLPEPQCPYRSPSRVDARI